MRTLSIFLLILAVLGSIKSVVVLIWPKLAQRGVDWWMAVPTSVGRFLGTVLILLGLLLVGLAVVEIGEAVIGAVVIIGAGAIAAGIGYQYPRVWRAMAKPFSTSGNTWVLRAVAVLWLLICGALLFVAFRKLGQLS